MDTHEIMKGLFEKGKISKLKFLEYIEQQNLISLAEKVADGDASVNALAGSLVNVQKAIHTEREEAGIYVDKNISIDFTDSPEGAPGLLNNPEGADGPDEEFIGGLGEEDLESHE